MSASSNSPVEDFNFNDPMSETQNPNKRRRSSKGRDESPTKRAEEENGQPPKSKRIACIICRKRKLKCDGLKPSCATCTRLGHNCAYDEVRRKSGPKRGYVKALEERLKQVETLLKTQDPITTTSETPATSFVVTNNGQGTNPITIPNIEVNNASINYETSRDQDNWIRESPQQIPMDDLTFNTSMNMGMSMEETNFTWEMIGLGLDEPLPPQETVDDLHQLYFDKVHPSLPMIHKPRYLAAMNLAPSQRPPVCLRYAMWTLACSVTDRYSNLKEHFYQRARKYMEQDYLKGHGENLISVAHAQTHILLASYEFKMMFFPRAWMSTGSAVRLSQMMGLHRLDGAGLDVKQCLPPPRDWTEREERRRTFWMAFCEDRYASIGTGWPMTIDEKDILTNLPASEEAFEKSKPHNTQTLEDSLRPSGAANISAFAGVCVMACLFGRNLVHLHRPDEDDKDNDLNGEYWKRHRHMDNILLNTSLNLPEHLKLPSGLSTPNIVFTNMNIHTSTICLHQAAIYKADKNRLPASVSKESKLRCITSANEIASIMRMISHLDLAGMNPFIAFCLYVAARVFVQYLKSRPDDASTADSLRFLLTAMYAMKARNPLTESFLVQLDVDLESLGMRNPKFKYFTQTARALSFNGHTPPTFGSKLDPTGPGKVDQCNFLKIIDDSVPNPDNVQKSYTQQVTLSTTTTNQVSDFNFNNGDMNWMTEVTSGQNTISNQDQNNMYSRIHIANYNPSDSASASLNPDTSTEPSDRPTPSSSISDNLRGKSGSSSFTTSPGTNSNIPSRGIFAAEQVDFSMNDTGNENVNMNGTGSTNAINGISNTGNTDGSGNIYGMADTPGRAFAAQGWEMSQGLTPVGEGMFQALMEVGPMDIGWDFGEGLK